MAPDNDLEVGKQATIEINPEILKWTIESSGWEIDDLARRLKVKPDTIQQWYKESKIEISKLEQLAENVKRPLGVFFLPKPPVEHELTDYRKLGGIKSEKLSRKTLSAIRESRYLQSIAKELMLDQKMNVMPEISKVTLNDDPETIAFREREKLGFHSDDGLLSKEVKGEREFYNKLREKIESFNIFVFQINMPVEEARGFTLSDVYPVTIIVNSSDLIKPRIFTLLHEYGHILIKRDGICLPESHLATNNNKNDLQKIERWCNTFAASLLMPKAEFLDEVAELENTPYTPKRILTLLSNKFKASQTAVVVRMKNLTPNRDYLQFYDEALEEIEKKEISTSKKKKGGPSPVNKCIGQKGRKFISLVLDSKEKQTVDYNEMIDYLDISVKQLGKLQEKI